MNHPTFVDAGGRPLRPRLIDLERFFHPAVVAVVGASDTAGRPNTGIWRHLVAWGERVGATVIPVNPGRETVDDRTCHRTLSDVPEPVDLVAVLVSDAAPVVSEAASCGARFAVVFASGFAELGADGARQQARLAEIVEASELHLLGPNTNLNAFENFRDELPGRSLAMITQSGHQGRPIFQSQELGIRVSHWAPTGNEVDLEFADFATWFADQPDVGAIAAYIEGFKDGRTLALAADHAAAAGVPIVCVKVGRTEVGAVGAASHTGKLTGSDAVIDAAFRQFGITRVDGLDELIDTAALMARYPDGPADEAAEGVVVYSISGGTGAHFADLASAAGLTLPALSDDLQARLHEWIPDYLRVANPVDNGGHPVGDERGRKILDALVSDPDVGVLVCPITGAFPPMSDRLAQDLVDVAETTAKPICVIWGSPVGTEDAYRKILLSSSKLAVFRTFGNCVTAIRAWRDWHRFRTTYRSPFVTAASEPSSTSVNARALLAGGPVSEHDAKALLARYGVPVTREQLVTTREGAIEAARQLGGDDPVVLKVSGDVAHKSEIGGVRLGVVDDDVGSTFDELARLGSGEVLVCEQIAAGVEAIVGVASDPLFGPTIMVGLGGIFAEVLRDVQFLIPPFHEADVRRAIDALHGRAMFDGVRGAPAADVDSLVELLMNMQRLVNDLGHDIAEIDINPVIVRPRNEGAVAVDALVVKRDDDAAPSSS